MPSKPVQGPQRQLDLAAHQQQQQQASQVACHDPAVRHPVFFTDRFRRSFLSLPAGAASNPVAQGYVWEQLRTKVEDQAKL